MFDIGFSELFLVFVIGLVVLGPKRLPVAVKTVLGWMRALRSLATSVQNELAQELKLQELQDSLKKVEKATSVENLTPELKASMDELRQAAESMRRSYHLPDVEKASDAINRILPLTAGTEETAVAASPVDHSAAEAGIVEEEDKRLSAVVQEKNTPEKAIKKTDIESTGNEELSDKNTDKDIMSDVVDNNVTGYSEQRHPASMTREQPAATNNMSVKQYGR